MRFLLRADAGVATGTGHVMRCLTLAEELTARGHEVALHGQVGVAWLQDQVAAAAVDHASAPPDTLDVDAIADARWDAVILDSYGIAAEAVSALDRRIPVLAIIDGEDRGIDARLYLDQNLGAELVHHRPGVSNRLLAGSRYALVRRAIRDLRREDRWKVGAVPRVLAFIGGSDSLRSMPRIAASLRELDERIALTLIAAPATFDEVESILTGRPNARVIGPTRRLPFELADADIVVSAAGTSAWDIGTMALPAVFAAVVDNQQAGLRQIVSSQVAVGLDASVDPQELSRVGELVAELLDDVDLRRSLVERCLETFDGRGAARVADALERVATGSG